MKLSKNKILWLTAAIAVVGAGIVWSHKVWTIGQQAYYRTYYGLASKSPRNNSGSRIDTVYFESSALGKKMAYAVYVPGGYDENQTEKYPVLYLLHGDPGNFRDWVVNANLANELNQLITEKRIPPLLIVCPDGNGGPVSASEYVNATKVRQNMEDYIISDVRKDVESRYRTIEDRSGRAIGGNSSGGFGSANIFFKHQNLYSVALIFGGYYENWNKELDSVLGNDLAAMSENSPMSYLEKIKHTKPLSIYLTIGSKDRASLVAQNKKFDELLTKLGIEHTLALTSGIHNWSNWNKSLPNALDYLNNHLPVWNPLQTK